MSTKSETSTEEEVLAKYLAQMTLQEKDLRCFLNKMQRNDEGLGALVNRYANRPRETTDFEAHTDYVHFINKSFERVAQFLHESAADGDAKFDYATAGELLRSSHMHGKVGKVVVDVVSKLGLSLEPSFHSKCSMSTCGPY